MSIKAVRDADVNNFTLMDEGSIFEKKKKFPTKILIGVSLAIIVAVALGVTIYVLTSKGGNSGSHKKITPLDGNYEIKDRVVNGNSV